jgi:NADPH:quinone reductase-like Zn-dependent oxidoreductase
MKAVRIHSFGGPEVLQLDEIAIPKSSTATSW